jgi:hypothetical protein
MTLTPARLRAFLRDLQKPAGEFGCWEWTGVIGGGGYGKAGDETGAHRVAYEWMVGPIPEGLELDHLCRNPRCVNPHHLEPVCHPENVRRAREYGPNRFREYCRRGHDQTSRGATYLKKRAGGRENRVCRECVTEQKRRVRQRHVA